MNIQELTTWNRLQALDFDAADAALPFSARLARDNAWSRNFAGRALEEYRKFCFLAVHAGHPVTPSDEVDQVWHLHLLYSRHYWETLCRDTLGMALHHGPTEGGADEGRKFHSWYESTLDSYRRYFGEPPTDLWPASDERFHARHDFVRIDRRDLITLDRALLRRGAIASALFGASALAVTQALAQTGAAGPRSYAGVWLGLLAITAVVVGIAAIVRRAGRTHKLRKSRVGAGFAGGCGGHHGAKGGGSDGHAGADGGHSGCGGSSGCGGGGCGGS